MACTSTQRSCQSSSDVHGLLLPGNLTPMFTCLPGTCQPPCLPAGYFALSFCQAVFTFAARLMHSTAPTVQQRLADATGQSEADGITPAQSSALAGAKPASLSDVVSPWAPSGSGVNLPDASEWLCTELVTDGWLCRGGLVPSG